MCSWVSLKISSYSTSTASTTNMSATTTATTDDKIFYTIAKSANR
jgi:hypothetical protein